MQTLICAKCSQIIEQQAVQGPAGWMHPRCAGGSSARSVLPVVAAIGCGVPAAFGVLIAIFLAIWQFLSPGTPGAHADGGRMAAASAAGDAGDDDALTERYQSPGGMLVAHYPTSFAASPTANGALTLQRPYLDGNVAAVILEAVEHPVSSDIKEVDRLLVAAEAKILPGYVVETRRPATCLGNKGLEIIAAHAVENGTAYTRRSCRFLLNGHLYSFAYALPKDRAAEGSKLLESIVEATEVLR